MPDTAHGLPPRVPAHRRRDARRSGHALPRRPARRGGGAHAPAQLHPGPSPGGQGGWRADFRAFPGHFRTQIGHRRDGGSHQRRGIGHARACLGQPFGACGRRPAGRLGAAGEHADHAGGQLRGGHRAAGGRPVPDPLGCRRLRHPLRGQLLPADPRRADAVRRRGALQPPAAARHRRLRAPAHGGGLSPPEGRRHRPCLGRPRLHHHDPPAARGPRRVGAGSPMATREWAPSSRRWRASSWRRRSAAKPGASTSSPGSNRRPFPGA